MSNSKLIGIGIADTAAGHKDLFEQAFKQCPCLQTIMKAYPDLVITDDDSTQGSINEWMDNQEVMFALHISLRTLQTLRSNGTLPYSRIRNKIFYRRRDIERILNDNYSKKGGQQ
jgi:hypothetical protein